MKYKGYVTFHVNVPVEVEAESVADTEEKMQEEVENMSDSEVFTGDNVQFESVEAWEAMEDEGEH